MYLTKVIMKQDGEYIGRKFKEGDAVFVDGLVARQLITKGLADLPPVPDKQIAPVTEAASVAPESEPPRRRKAAP